MKKFLYHVLVKIFGTKIKVECEGLYLFRDRYVFIPKKGAITNE